MALLHQRCEIVNQEDRQRERLCWSYQDALGVLVGYASDPGMSGSAWEIWSIADDETETRMSRYAEILIP